MGAEVQERCMSDLTFFLSLETRVWQALKTGDAAADKALLAPDFLGVYCTGFSDRAGHIGQLDTGPTVANYTLSQARIITLGQGRVLLAYHAKFTRIRATESEAMYISSIWEQRGETWRNTFSQDSNAADTPPV